MEIPKVINERWVALIALGLIILGIGWRLAPHLPNFAPIGAIALIAGVALGWRTALTATLGMVMVSDLLIGFYPGIAWTWLGYGLIVGLGASLRSAPLAWRIPVGVLGTSCVFFIVSNFGTWIASGMYSHDIAGFVQCYVMALPFYKATMLSDLVFGSCFITAHTAGMIFSKHHDAAGRPLSDYMTRLVLSRRVR